MFQNPGRTLNSCPIYLQLVPGNAMAVRGPGHGDLLRIPKQADNQFSLVQPLVNIFQGGR